LLSTTDRSGERGQTLPLFALAILVLLGFAALAFDGGQMLLDRRTEQNAADAAALAGARYIITNAADARDEAMRVAYQNGFGAGPTYSSSGDAGPNGTTVTVRVPPGSSAAAGFRTSEYIEVEIASSRPSIFGAVIGFFTQQTGARATASNQDNVAANFSMLALNPTKCQAANFGGTGTVEVGGNIQVNSNATCPQGAFNAGGTSSVEVTAENGTIEVVGTAKCGGASSCDPTPTQGSVVPDPLASLPAPPFESPTAAVVSVVAGGKLIPAGCPGGSSPATAAAPATCTFNSSYAGTTWLLSPGYYPGGISVLGGTVFLRPGVYYMAGGGLNAAGTGANLYSVSSAWSSSTAPNCSASSGDCGGVLIYNTNDPGATSGAASVKNMQPISLNGAASIIHLYPLQDAGPYTNIVIFQDRTQPSSSSGDLQLNGNSANLYVQGTIYVPKGYVKVEGTGNLGPSQIIADTFSITGGGTLGVGYDQDLVAQLIAVGLVE
jgi:Flp pilus assembly protein TadG